MSSRHVLCDCALAIHPGTRVAAKFLFEVVVDLHIWYNDAALYTKEGAGITPSTPAGLIGFRRKIGDGSSTPREGAPLPHYSHPEFQGLVTKWHNSATDASLSFPQRARNSR